MFKIYPINIDTGKERYKDFDPKATHGGSIYLHYALESENGYDIGSFDRKTLPEEDGIYDAVAIVEDGREIPCNLYLWYPLYNGEKQPVYGFVNREFCGYAFKGLVCKKDDVEGNADAKAKFERREEFI